MTKLLATTTLLLTLLVSPTWSETLTTSDLVERNGLFYKKFTDIPFTGEVSGRGTSGYENGKFKEGKKVGKWEKYCFEGTLRETSIYKNGKLNGLRLIYMCDGSISGKVNYLDGIPHGKYEFYWQKNYSNELLLKTRGTFNKGKKEGLHQHFFRYGTGNEKGNYKSDLRDGEWSVYHNGSLFEKGFYSKGKKEGLWVRFNEDGSILKDKSVTYKNGEKVSD